MSLRSFHIFFIVISLMCLAFVAWWSGHRILRGEDGRHILVAGTALAGLALGIPYLAWFVRNTKAPPAM